MTAVAADTGAYEAHAKRDPLLLLHKGVYFLVYAGGVCYVPFLPLFLSGSGFSPAAVGGILALRPIALLLATPLFGAIADRGYRRIVLSGAIVVSTLLRGAVALTTSAPLIAALVLLGEAASAPITSVLDAAVLGILERTSSTANYGRTRMLGSVGFGVMAPFAGLLRDSVGPRAAVAAFVLITLVGGALAWWLPFERERAFLSSGGGGGGAGGRPPKPDSGGQAAAAAPALVSEPLPEAAAVLGVPDAPAAVSSASSGLGLGAFLQPSALLLLSAVAVMGVLSALIGNFHFLFLQSLGAGGGLMGWAILCNILAEAPAFMAAPLVLQRIPVPAVLCVALGAYAARFLGYSALAAPAWTLPLELLHGATFALGWAAATQYAHDRVSPDLSTTALAILSAVHSGAGSSVGGALGGQVFAAWGARALWRTGAGLAAGGLLLVGASELAAWREATACKPAKKQ